jgi:hypothetical protein
MANLLGINVSWPVDWNGDRLFADVARTCRGFSGAVDAAYWPTTSATTVGMWDGSSGLDQMHGTYAIRFKGNCTGITSTYGTVTPTGGTWATAYDGTYTTATLAISQTTGINVQLTFAGAYRDAGHTQPGLTALQVMRPIAPGSATPHGYGEVTNRAVKALLQQFTTIRFMDFLEINSNHVTKWSDRTLPGWASASTRYMAPLWGQGRGASWEDLISVANDVGRDVWICVPAEADFAMVPRLTGASTQGKLCVATPGDTVSVSYPMKVLISTSGDLGTMQVQVSHDGGSSYGAAQTVPAGGVLYDSFTGLTLQFGGGWSTPRYTAGDYWMFTSATSTFSGSSCYAYKLAQALLYGTDGTNPYASTQGSPVYPPLSSGLKVWVEYSNEVWNSGGVYDATDFCLWQAAASVAADSSTANILCYDSPANGTAPPARDQATCRDLQGVPRGLGRYGVLCSDPSCPRLAGRVVRGDAAPSDADAVRGVRGEGGAPGHLLRLGRRRLDVLQPERLQLRRHRTVYL